jgi:hypothetical protein
VLVAAIAIGGNCFAADVTFNFNLTPVAEINPHPGGRFYGDVWAEGGYVYLGTDVNDDASPNYPTDILGLSIFSISNAGIPTYLTTYAGDQFEDVEVWNGIGYVGSDVSTTSGTGVDVLNLAIPFEPELLTRINGSNAHKKVHTLSVSEGYLYTVDNNPTVSAADSVKIFNVSNPSSPQFVASVPITSVDQFASHEVIVRNDRMYVASKNNGSTTCCGWTHIFDVSNPASPVLLKAFLSGPRTHTAVPSDDGKLLIVAEERPDGNVHIYDISMINSPNDPDNPVWKATLNRTNVGIDAHSPHHPHLHGNLLFLTWYEAGLQVFNISNPANPVHVGAFDTCRGDMAGPCAGSGTSSDYNGNWGVDLSLGLNKVLLSDRSRGLIVVDATGVVAPGDYNQDMVVNDSDYLVWRTSFASGSSGLHTAAFADGNYNGTVDAADYVIWRKHKGETGPPPGGAGTSFIGEPGVPEPTSIFLLAAGVGLSIALRRGRMFVFPG